MGRKKVALPADRVGQVNFAAVSADYFSVFGLRPISGRGFLPADVGAANKPMIVNQSTAKLYWPGESAVGKLLSVGDNIVYTIVGVVPDMKYESVGETGVPFAYSLIQNDPLGGNVSVVTRSADPRASLAGLRAVMHAVDPGLPVLDAGLVSDRVARVLMPQRFGATLLTIFAFVAVAVCVVGIYGTLAYAVAHRTPEIGIRMALGARSADIIRLVLAQTAVVIVVGITIGLGGAALGSRALEHFLFGISRLDPVAFGLSAAVLGMLAVLIALIPATSAVRIDPVKAIRASQ